MAFCLVDDGVVVIEEGDRIYGLCARGYKEVIVEEASGEKVVVSYHAGYDFYRGVFKRLFINHNTGEKALADFRFWDIAGQAAILWVFFKDVDFYPIQGYSRGFLIARSRRRIDPREYSKLPRIASKV